MQSSTTARAERNSRPAAGRIGPAPEQPLPPGVELPGWQKQMAALMFLRDSKAFVGQQVQRVGPMFTVRALGSPTVVVTGHENIEWLLTAGMECVTWRDGWPPNVPELMGNVLFLQDGETHRMKRRLLLSAFTRKAMEGYLPRIEAYTVRHLEQWSGERSFEWEPRICRLTFEVASDLMLGTEPGDGDHLAQAFADLTAGFSALPLKIPGTTYHRGFKGRRVLLEHLDKAVRRRMQNLTDDALSRLIQGRDDDGNSLSFEELKDQSLFLLLAGHDTTASLMTSLVYRLGNHPEVFEKARREQLDLDISGPLTMEQLKKMKYLDQVLKETERMHPPVPIGFRGATQEFELGGFRIPKGWRLLYRSYETHMDPEVFDDPKHFDPERFGPERAEHKRKRFALFGFGGGPRLCIGYSFSQVEMKVIASHLLRHYRWLPTPDQDLRQRELPFLNFRKNYRVNFERTG